MLDEGGYVGGFAGLYKSGDFGSLFFLKGDCDLDGRHTNYHTTLSGGGVLGEYWPGLVQDNLRTQLSNSVFVRKIGESNAQNPPLDLTPFGET